MNEENFKSGLILEPLDKLDWKFGSSGLGTEIRIEDGDWSDYLPTNEKQKKNYETMSCVSFSALNCIEIEFEYLFKNKLLSLEDMEWLCEKGYLDTHQKLNLSDRYIATLSGTGANGNSLKKVADTIRKNGVIPEKMLPWADSKSEYLDKNKVTSEMIKLGQEWKRRFPINYEAVDVSEFSEALKKSVLQWAVHAWNGTKYNEHDYRIYVKTDNRINHACTGIKKPPRNWKALDHYKQDGNFIKKLEPDFKFMSYGYRFIVSYSKKKIMKTIKQKEQSPIYIISNSDSSKLYQIGAWESYERFLKEKWILPFEEVENLNDYKIENGIVGLLQ